jgi:hypothetical protein
MLSIDAKADEEARHLLMAGNADILRTSSWMPQSDGSARHVRGVLNKLFSA